MRHRRIIAELKIFRRLHMRFVRTKELEETRETSLVVALGDEYESQSLHQKHRPRIQDEDSTPMKHAIALHQPRLLSCRLSKFRTFYSIPKPWKIRPELEKPSKWFSKPMTQPEYHLSLSGNPTFSSSESLVVSIASLIHCVSSNCISSNCVSSDCGSLVRTSSPASRVYCILRHSI